jgi:adenylate cyclase
VSGKVYEEVRDKLKVPFEDRGEQEVKNIARPVRVYAVVSQSPVINRALPALPDKPSIAVLPFANLSADPEQEFFSEGIAEDIITELSRISAFFVVARNSTFTYKGRAVDVKQVGRELGVRYVVEGSVRRMGDRVRITAQLIEASTGAHVWADRFDRAVAELFEVQDEVIRSIVASTQTQVVINEGVLAEQADRPDLRVWELAKRGWKNLYGLTAESLSEARRLGRAAVAADPMSSKGHQVIGAANFHLAFMGFADDREALADEALREAQEATRLDRRDEYSFWVLGMVLGILLGRTDEAVAALKQALDINPNFSVAYGSLGTTLAIAGRAKESIEFTQTAMRLNPRDPSFFFRYSMLSLAYFSLEQFDQAREWADGAVARKADWWLGHALLTASREKLGDHDGAKEAATRFMAAFPRLRAGELPIRLRSVAVREALEESLRSAGVPA